MTTSMGEMSPAMMQILQGQLDVSSMRSIQAARSLKVTSNRADPAGAWHGGPPTNLAASGGAACLHKLQRHCSSGSALSATWSLHDGQWRTTQVAHGIAALAVCSLPCRLPVLMHDAVLGQQSTCSCCISDAHPLVFFRRALTTSFTPRFICLRLAAFFASFSTCSVHCHALHLSSHSHRRKFCSWQADLSTELVICQRLGNNTDGTWVKRALV